MQQLDMRQLELRPPSFQPAMVQRLHVFVFWVDNIILLFFSCVQLEAVKIVSVHF